MYLHDLWNFLWEKHFSPSSGWRRRRHWIDFLFKRLFARPTNAHVSPHVPAPYGPLSKGNMTFSHTLLCRREMARKEKDGSTEIRRGKGWNSRAPVAIELFQWADPPSWTYNESSAYRPTRLAISPWSVPVAFNPPWRTEESRRNIDIAHTRNSYFKLFGFSIPDVTVFPYFYAYSNATRN